MLVLGVAFSLCVCSPAAARTWYVGATATAGGDGSNAKPFSQLADVERASAPGDAIVILASPASTPALGGGIALKPGQKLTGDGPPVTGLKADASAPRITNADTAQHSGDAITLADGVEVANIVVTGAARGGIYGKDVKDVSVRGNDVSATNTSCATGFVVQPFVLPTFAPGVGVPFSSGLSNGWAGIMVDESHTSTTVTIEGNSVHDADCADGIDVRASGTADVTAHVAGNTLTRLRQDPGKQSILAIGMQTTDTSRLVAEVNGNTMTYIGTATVGDFGEADSEGLFANSAGRSHLIERADRNTFAHGLGHISANCVEVAASNGGPTMEFTLTNSTCDYVVGDILEAANLSKDATLTFNIDHVRAAHSTFGGSQAFHQVEPGDDGDCLLEVASGSGSTTNVNISNSLFTDCVADGIGIVSNVVDGAGSVKKIALDVRNSRIGDNKLSNLRVANITPVDEIAVKVEHTDLSESDGTLVILEGLDTSGNTHAKLDLGGGALTSAGHNCILGGAQGSVMSARYDLDAKQNWWGDPGGPPAGSTVTTGTINFAPPLTRSDCGPVAGTVLGPVAPVAPAATCGSKRKFVIHLPRSWRRATVTVNGHRARVRRIHGRLTATIDLHGLPRTVATVRARGVDRHKRRVSQRRRYHPCRAGHRT